MAIIIIVASTTAVVVGVFTSSVSIGVIAGTVVAVTLDKIFG